MSAEGITEGIIRRLLRTFYLCILNLKGGIGKTTTATHLAYYFACILGYRVLLIDCDMQANSSIGLTTELDGPLLTNVLQGEVPLHHAIRKVRENLYLVPSDRTLKEAAKHIISQGMGGYTLLQRSLKALETGEQLKMFHAKFPLASTRSPFVPIEECIFDIVIGDNAGLTPVTEADLFASDAILSPVEMEYFSYEGVFVMMEMLEEVMNNMGRDLDILGVIPYNIDERFKMTDKYRISLKKEYEVEIAHPIRTDAAVKYAQPKAKTVFETEPHSNVAHDFQILGDQILARIQEDLLIEQQEAGRKGEASNGA